MPNATIEYVILVPLLFAQVIVFPLVASTLATNWQNTQLEIALQDAADHLASTFQQLYLSVSDERVLAGTITVSSPLPRTIGSYPYNATCSLSSPPEGSAKVLTVTLTLDETRLTANASAVLGTNIEWLESTLRSTSTDASISIEKDVDGTLTFRFGEAD